MLSDAFENCLIAKVFDQRLRVRGCNTHGQNVTKWQQDDGSRVISLLTDDSKITDFDALTYTFCMHQTCVGVGKAQVIEMRSYTHNMSCWPLWCVGKACLMLYDYRPCGTRHQYPASSTLNLKQYVHVLLCCSDSVTHVWLRRSMPVCHPRPAHPLVAAPG